jgi:phospholipid-transporting ATPase
MLKEAHIGVGIVSALANYASYDTGNHSLSSSDFAIGQFKHIKPLILYHGRENYRRNSYMIFYIFYKNLLFVAPLFLFGIYSGFSGESPYEMWSM